MHEEELQVGVKSAEGEREGEGRGRSEGRKSSGRRCASRNSLALDVFFPCNMRVKSAPDWLNILHSVYSIGEMGTCWDWDLDGF